MTTHTWKATDDGGLTATCALTVTVNCGASPETVNEQRESIDLTTLSRPVSGSNLALSLAPNPASTDLQITVEGLDESEGTLTIFDAAGRLVWQSTANGQQSIVNSQ